MDHVLVKRVQDSTELLQAIEHLLLLCDQATNTARHIQVIVVDSIASIIQFDFNNYGIDLVARSKLLFKVSSKLKYIATKFINIDVVVTNDVRDTINDTLFTTNNIALRSSNRSVAPALGLAWLNCVTNRFFFSMENVNAQRLRTFKVVFSPYLPTSECPFHIDEDGVKG